MMVQERMRRKQKYAEKLRELFACADESGDGKITEEEFGSMLSDPSMTSYLGVLDLDVHEVMSLFHLLDDGDGHVTYDEFVKGVLQLKGQARSQDVIAILHDTQKILNLVHQTDEAVQQALNKVPDNS